MSNNTSGRTDPEFREIDNVGDYYATDLARTYGFTESGAAAMVDTDQLEAQHKVLLEQGYVIIENPGDAGGAGRPARGITPVPRAGGAQFLRR